MSLFGLIGPPNIQKLEAKSDITGLTRALSYRNDPQVRLFAARALGRVGDDSAIGPLIAALQDRDLVVCNAAGEALASIHITWSRSEAAHAVVPMLIALLKDNCANTVSAPRDGYELERKNSAKAVPRVAAKTLGKIKDAHAREALIAALKAWDDGLRYCAEVPLKLNVMARIDGNWRTTNDYNMSTIQ